MNEGFGALGQCRIALEVGTHFPWVGRLLKSSGHEVIVANARQVKLITETSRKNDKLDAQTLARLARIDPERGPDTDLKLGVCSCSRVEARASAHPPC